MENAIHRVPELNAEVRHALESLLGRALEADETVVVRAFRSALVKEAAQGTERAQAAQRLAELMSLMANRAQGVPEDEIDAAIDEAVDYVRHNRE
ncbi:MAG: hypothetical protein ACKV22_03455 [Bryobacteraceae bacterium]